jgi:hypothetical protein
VKKILSKVKMRWQKTTIVKRDDFFKYKVPFLLRLKRFVKK